jgi:hypothetical protein
VNEGQQHASLKQFWWAWYEFINRTEYTIYVNEGGTTFVSNGAAHNWWR